MKVARLVLKMLEDFNDDGVWCGTCANQNALACFIDLRLGLRTIQIENRDMAAVTNWVNDEMRSSELGKVCDVLLRRMSLSSERLSYIFNNRFFEDSHRSLDISILKSTCATFPGPFFKVIMPFTHSKRSLPVESNVT